MTIRTIELDARFPSYSDLCNMVACQAYSNYMYDDLVSPANILKLHADITLVINTLIPHKVKITPNVSVTFLSFDFEIELAPEDTLFVRVILE
ncbi:hypothetical protein BN80_222 [Yersinia phage phiR1-RT]|uniref:DUF7355 domain-containing protein n=2 Tax=Tegunavirus TaxID=1921704 RepID=A0A0B4ZXJ0_9CAUD|nr:hypothetical protein BN80_222 [Yersinia phage phiR1-RT]YP_009200478.1 hypothetical protein AVV33_gp178 [Yersinia phage vB_YenM_TG1]AJD82027.1 hypothetical protein YenMTG1_217 [Yersinia phage vB_YenM_TG1]CCI88792.1 hypothetical protein BN80_222 [Yersinia phage phiR1-RT]